MENVAINLSDLGGGIVDGIPPLNIEDNQFERLVNFYPFGTKLVRRAGVRQVTTVAADSDLTALLTFSNEGDHYVVAGLVNGFAWNNAGVMTRIPKIDGVLPEGRYLENEKPWSMVQYKSEIFAVRPGSYLQRLTSASAELAGVVAPTVPGAVVGAAGGVTAGDHSYFVTFVTSTGNESPESEEVTVTCAVDSIVTLTVPVSATPRVVKRRIWRSLSNDAGQGWLVDTIEDNTTTLYVDTTPDAELGIPFEYGNLLPPSDRTSPAAATAYALCSWKHRLWMIDPASLFCSKTGRFETFDQTFQGFDQYSGHVLRGIAAWDERLVVATTKKMFYVTQTGVDETGVRFDIEELSEEHGCVAHHSIKTAEGNLFWFAGDNVYMSTGGKPRAITTVRVRRILDQAKALHSDRWEFAVGSINTDLGWYQLSLSVNSSTRNDTTIIYDYKNDRWFTFEHFSNLEAASYAPSAVMEYFDENYARTTYAGFGEKRHLYELNSGARDVSDQVRAIAKGKAFQRNNGTSVFRKLSINCTSANEYMTLRLYRDGESELSAINERLIYLMQSPARDWKRVALSGQGPQVTTVPRLKSRSFQVEIDYTGDTAIEVNGLLLEVDSYEMTRRPI